MNLLHTAGYEFEARKSGFPELVLEDPIKTVRANAEGKALAVAQDPDTVVLAADTIVYLPDLPMHDRILGQARNKEDVRRFIDLLQGRAHEVYTGVAVARGEDLTLRHAVTSVRMRVLGSRRSRILRPLRGGHRKGRRIRRAGTGRILRGVDRRRLHQRRRPTARPHRKNARQRRNPTPLKGQCGRHQVHESPHAKAIGLHVKLFIQSQKACSPKFGKTRSYTYERPYLRSVALRHVQSVPMYRK